VVEKKPATLDEYAMWLKSEHDVESLDEHRINYETIAYQMKTAFERSSFWSLLSEKKLRDFDEEYRLTYPDYPLLMTPDPPQLLTKSFESFLGKTFRINVLHNRNWPKEPFWLNQKSWILPRNWFSRINDIVRACIVVKYFDGVKFLASRLEGECANHDLRSDIAFQARDEGHYAAHFYIKYDCAITSLNGVAERIATTVEVQITTQLQDAIRALLHTHYESRRDQPTPTHDWKWDHTSSEFATNYLGHVLHYVEGMIVELRDRQRKQP
jgi:hypothetical protein